MAQRAYSCTLKKGYARNVCAFTNYDTLTCLTRVLTFTLPRPILLAASPADLRRQDTRTRANYTLSEPACRLSNISMNSTVEQLAPGEKNLFKEL